MSLARKILLAAVAASVSLLAFAAAVTVSYRTGVSRTDEMAQRSLRALTLVTELERLVVDMQTAVRSFYLGRAEVLLDPYLAATERYPVVLGELRARLESTPDRELLEGLDRKVTSWRSTVLEPRIAHIRQAPARPTPGDLVLPRLPREPDILSQQRQVDTIRSDCRVLLARVGERVLDGLAALDRECLALELGLWIAAAALATAFLGGVGLLLASFRRRAAPLLAGLKAAEQGAYRAIPVGNDDEVGRIAQAFNRMVETLGARDAALRLAIGELESVNRELIDFASIAAHDLQEPLRRIRAFGDRLQTADAAALGERGREDLDRMIRAAARMSTIVDDLLDYQTVAIRTPRFAPVDLAAVAARVTGDLEALIGTGGATVEIAPLPTIAADPGLMSVLFTHLLDNALKFRLEGVPPRILIDATEAAPGIWAIRFTDNGRGFDPRYAERLFRPFERLQADDEAQGSGMGLAICRRIAACHGGTIVADGSPGRGATFTVTLPARADARRRAA